MDTLTVINRQGFIDCINTKSLQHFHFLIGLVNSENDLCSEEIKVCVESLEGVSTNLTTRL